MRHKQKHIMPPFSAQKSNISPKRWSRTLYLHLHLLPPGVNADGKPPNVPSAGDINSWTTTGSIMARELRETQLVTHKPDMQEVIICKQTGKASLVSHLTFVKYFIIFQRWHNNTLFTQLR